MSKIRRNWFPLTLALCVLACLICIGYVFAQVSPQIQGAGAPSNPCNNGGQQYVDQTNHVIYSCPSSGSNWVNIGLGQGTSSGFTNNGTQLTGSLPVLLPPGSATAPSYAFSGFSNYGAFLDSSNNYAVANNGNEVTRTDGAGNVVIKGILFLGASGASLGSQNDNDLSRDSAGVIDVGAGGGGTDTTGKLQAAGFISKGSTFAASGCANSTLVGGATAGTYKSVTGGSCTVTITMGNTATSPNGWACDAHDLTTVADANNVTMGSSTTTTANLVEGTVVANDIIAFKCVGY